MKAQRGSVLVGVIALSMVMTIGAGDVTMLGGEILLALEGGG